MKTLEMLITEIKNSEALQKLLAEAVKNNALAAFLKEQGVDAAAEEFIAALKAQAEQLDGDALDAVAGGANAIEIVVTVSGTFKCNLDQPIMSFGIPTPDKIGQCLN